MSSSVATEAAGPADAVSLDAQPAPARRGKRWSRRRRSHGAISRVWVKTHRWVSLAVGLFLLLELVTGAVLLYLTEINQAVYPERYVATASATPMSQLEALRMVQAQHPEVEADGVALLASGAYEVEGDTESAFIDPGTGTITAIAEPSPWIVQLILNIHDCALACDEYPGYQEWLTAPMPFTEGQDEPLEVGEFLLGSSGVLVLFLVISGAIIWWPGLRGWITGFIVRRRRGPYVRDLDLHGVVGMVGLPFIFMWAFTGASFEFDWPEQAYYAALPGNMPEDQEVAEGTGPMITFEQVIAETQRLHPEAIITGLGEENLDEPGGSLRVYYQEGYDPYRYSSYPGDANRVEIGINGGETLDSAIPADAPIAERLWENDTYEGLHYGTIINGWWRIIWLVFGLTPVLLGITGVTIWLTKRRSRRNRAQRRAAVEA